MAAAVQLGWGLLPGGGVRAQSLQMPAEGVAGALIKVELSTGHSRLRIGQGDAASETPSIGQPLLRPLATQRTAGD